MNVNLCYILHSYPYRDNSLILQCLSLERGLISFLSKGARSSKKNLLSLLQPFQPLSITYAGKGDLFILTGVEASSMDTGSAVIKPSLKGKSIYCAYYVNELYLRLLSKDEPNTPAFALYQKTIERLVDQDKLEKTLRIFEINLLEILGYQPNLDYDIKSGEAVSAAKDYYFDLLSGPYAVDTALTKPEYKTQNQILKISGNTLLSIKSLNFDSAYNSPCDSSQILKQSKQLLTQLLQCHLGDKPLKSKEVYRQLYATNKKY